MRSNVGSSPVSLLIYVLTLAIGQCWQPKVVHTAPRRLRLFHCTGRYESPIDQRTYRKETRHALFSTVQDVLEPEQLLDRHETERLSDLVERRAEARSRGEYQEADKLKDEIFASLRLPDGVSLQLRDLPRTEGGGSTWTVLRDDAVADIEPMPGTTVLQLAHTALGLTIALSEARSSASTASSELDELVAQAKARLVQEEHVRVELRGRKAADAAFWFALAGVTDVELMESLADVCSRELERFGRRSSCRAKDVYHIVQRFAAAGVRSHSELQRAATKALATKEDVSNHIGDVSDLLNLHSDHCLLMIWRFSTRQRKQKAFLQSALRHWEREQQIESAGRNETLKFKGAPTTDWPAIFKDPRRPLVVDIGCGMGLSLLGLAQYPGEKPCSLGNWSDYNFAGVDLSGLAVGYASGLCRRWDLHDRLRFFVDDAESFMKRVVDSGFLSRPGSLLLPPVSDTISTASAWR